MFPFKVFINIIKLNTLLTVPCLQMKCPRNCLLHTPDFQPPQLNRPGPMPPPSGSSENHTTDSPGTFFYTFVGSLYTLFFLFLSVVTNSDHFMLGSISNLLVHPLLISSFIFLFLLVPN